MKPVHKPTPIALFFAGAIFSSHCVEFSVSSADCNETDALLRVSYTLIQEEWEGLAGDFQTLRVRPSGNVGNSTFSDAVDYYSPDDFVDGYEVCVPREGACLEVTLEGLPSNSYEVHWDGRTAEEEEAGRPELMGEFGDTVTSSEVGGGCIPRCDEGAGEALFEYKYWSSVGFEDYRVEDVADGSAVLRCDSHEDACQEDTYNSMHAGRACLRGDGCYRFLVGDNFRRIPGHATEPVESYYSLRWDGEAVERDPGRLFDSVEFGGDACAPACDPEEESLVEFFVHGSTSRRLCEGRDNPDDNEDRPPPDLSWAARVQDPGEGGSSFLPISSGVIPGCSDTSLHHVTICVPRDRCASFSLSSPEAHPAAVSPLYSLTMDDVVYRRGEFVLDDESSSFDGLNQTTIMGSSCDVDSAPCDGSGQALLEVDVVGTPLSEYVHENKSLSAFPTFEWGFFSRPIDAESNTKWTSAAQFGQDTADPGSVYRTIMCVPDDECAFEFQFLSEFPLEYSLKRNGIGLSERGRDDSDTYDVTLFGEDCGTGDNAPEGATEYDATNNNMEDAAEGTPEGAVVGDAAKETVEGGNIENAVTMARRPTIASILIVSGLTIFWL